MNRRSLLGLLACAGGALLPALGRPAAAAEAPAQGAKRHSIVLHVGRNDPEAMTLALNNASAAVETYSQRGEEVAIEIVANGPGLHMLRQDTSPVKAYIKDLHARAPQVSFTACGRSKHTMEQREGKEIRLVPEANVVPSGLVRITELQEQGWSYVKP